MDLVTFMLVIPGVLGGLLIALVIKLRSRAGTRAQGDIFTSGRLSTDVINMSSIRVAGIGGLGLVAMAVTVALNVPRIGQSLALGLLFGVVLAAALVLLRRRHGPMTSSGRHGGANTVLAIDERPPSADESAEDSSDVRTHVVSALPATTPVA